MYIHTHTDICVYIYTYTVNTTDISVVLNFHGRRLEKSLKTLLLGCNEKSLRNTATGCEDFKGGWQGTQRGRGGMSNSEAPFNR